MSFQNTIFVFLILSKFKIFALNVILKSNICYWFYIQINSYY